MLTQEVGRPPDSSMQACWGPAGRHPLPGASGAHFLPAAAKIAGLYNDSEPPRKTMRRGVLMTLLQQSAMTLPLWIGKPGDK